MTADRPDRTGLEPRLLRLLLVVTAVTPFVFLPGFVQPFVVPRVAFFRLLVAAAVLVAAAGWLRRPARLRLRGETALLALVTFAAVATAAALAGPVPGRGLLGTLNRMGGAIAWVFYLLFFLLLRVGLDDEGWRQLLRATAVVSGAVALYALVQAYGGALGIAVPGWGRARIWSTVGNPGPLAAYLTLSAAVAGHLWRTAAGRRARVLWICVLLLDLWVVLLTGTRAALLGLLFGAALLTGLVPALRGERRGWLRLGGLAGAAAVVTAVAILVLGGGLPAGERLLELGPSALENRLPMWEAAWRGFLERPLLGFGPESFDLLYDRYFEPAWYLASGSSHHDRAHEVLLGALAETGVPGALAYIVFWAAALTSLLRAWGQRPVPWLALGLAAYLVYLAFWFEDPVSFPTALVVVAYLVHRSRGRAWEARGAGSEPPAHRGLRWGAALAAVLVAAGGVLHAARSLAVARDLGAGTRLQPRPALARFSAALERDLPSTREVTSRYVAAADALVDRVRAGETSPGRMEMREIFATGRAALDREVRREPTNSVVRARRARLSATRFRWSGEEEAFRSAVDDLERARELSPGRLRHAHRLARLHASRGDTARAMELLRRARDRLPRWGGTWRVMAVVRWNAGAREGAVELLRRALAAEEGEPDRDFLFRVGAWLERDGRPADAARLYAAWLAASVRGWTEEDDRTPSQVSRGALPVAAHLPMVWLRAGDRGQALEAGRRLLERLPPHLDRPVVTDRLGDFLDDLQAGRADRWVGEWGVLPTNVSGRS